MNISVISFTKRGMELAKKLSKKLDKSDISKAHAACGVLCEINCRLYTKCTTHPADEGVRFVEESIGDWAKEQFDSKNAAVFIGACAIAVRAIAPHITDKLHDVPVIVIDEAGQFVIPVLSGHMGGANELAAFIAEKIGARAVITTATDINNKFAVDLFAVKNGLAVLNKSGIAKVSSKVLSGQTVTMSVETGHLDEDCRLPEGLLLEKYPPQKPVDILISSQAAVAEEFICNDKNLPVSGREAARGAESMSVSGHTLYLVPKEYVAGIGCKRGRETEKLEAFVLESLKNAGILPLQLAAVASVDLKKDEPGLVELCRKNNLPFITFTADELMSVEGDFHKSEFVREHVGADNVCERAALLACKTGGRLVYEKHASDGMTIAFARREWRISFDEK